MIVLLDTSTPTCKLSIVDGEHRDDHEWLADRQLARGLHAYLRDQLASYNATIHDITGIGVMQGPGSFTGLRIGITVMNTLADSMHVPIVATTGQHWADDAVQRLRSGDNDTIVMPYYGSEATITQPRK